jgi:hypothetical protein
MPSLSRPRTTKERLSPEQSPRTGARSEGWGNEVTCVLVGAGPVPPHIYQRGTNDIRRASGPNGSARKGDDERFLLN